MASGLKSGDQYIRSNEPADNGYGQNGYTGASSTTDPKNKPVSSNFVPELRTDLDKAKSVFAANKPGRLDGPKSKPIPGHDGLRDRLKTDFYPQVPGNNRPVKK
jgi:hypothetical protein